MTMASKYTTDDEDEGEDYIDSSTPLRKDSISGGKLRRTVSRTSLLMVREQFCQVDIEPSITVKTEKLHFNDPNIVAQIQTTISDELNVMNNTIVNELNALNKNDHIILQQLSQVFKDELKKQALASSILQFLCFGALAALIVCFWWLEKK